MSVKRFSSLLYVIGFIEFFERFGFYTLSGLLAVFLIKQKHINSTDAFHIFGAFSALLYAYVGLGGWCGEKILGPLVTLVFGLSVMLLGYLGLAFAPDWAFFPSLAGVCVGNGLFKANPATILGKNYQGQPQKLHSVFTIFYMTVNLGALFALLIGPFLADHYNYRYAFAVSAIGILIALVFVLVNYTRLNHTIQNLEFSRSKRNHFPLVLLVVLVMWGLTSYWLKAYEIVILALKILVMLLLMIYTWATWKEPKAIRLRLVAVIILMVEAVIFFTLYQQMPTSINLYAVLHVHSEFWGMHFDPQSFQALNPFWIIIWSPLLAKFYLKNAKSTHPWSIFLKFSLGMLSCSLSYVVLYASHFFADQQLQISPLWLVLSYIFQSLAELLVSALGLAMVAELVPNTWMGIVIGMWFLTSAVSGFTGAKLASLVVIPKAMQPSLGTLNQFGEVFAEIALVIFVISLIMFSTVKFLEQMTNKD